MADARQRQLTATPGRSKGEQTVLKKLALVAVCLASPGASATAQDAKTVIANAQKALGDPKSITYLGIGEGCGIPAVRGQYCAIVCRGRTIRCDR